MTNSGSIFISAGDPSADFPGKNLIDAIGRICPGLDVFGLGGPLMQASGLEPLADHRRLAVMGFWEIVPQMFFFRNLLKRTASEIEKRRPRAIILIDYPGFNLRLAARIKKLGIPIIYYISPQVWAWGKGRIKDIRRLVDLMLVIFPFEETFYEERGVPARFTGHPIFDRYRDIPDKESCRKILNIGQEEKLVALLPGSRRQEIKRMLPNMIQAAATVKEKIDHCRFIVAGVGEIDRSLYEDIIGKAGIPVLYGQTPEIINAADFVITSSGTATIETAYFATPMVVIYKTGFFTYQLARRLVTLDVIGMVNIVAGRRIVPELIQDDADPEKIAAHVAEIMTNDNLYQRTVTDLQKVRERLNSGDAGLRAAEAMQEKIGLC